MYGQVLFFRIMWLATAAAVLFLVIHAATEAFTRSAGVLTQAVR